MTKKTITEKEQKTAANILINFMFTKNMDDIIKVWNKIFEEYELCEDPFTKTPCTPKEYSKSIIEYEKQIMFEKYGHCDGLE